MYGSCNLLSCVSSILCFRLSWFLNSFTVVAYHKWFSCPFPDLHDRFISGRILNAPNLHWTLQFGHLSKIHSYITVFFCCCINVSWPGRLADIMYLRGYLSLLYQSTLLHDFWLVFLLPVFTLEVAGSSLCGALFFPVWFAPELRNLSKTAENLLNNKLVYMHWLHFVQNAKMYIYSKIVFSPNRIEYLVKLSPEV